MLQFRPILRRYGIKNCCHLLSREFQRNASLTSSIERGVRKAANALRAAEQRRLREGTLGFWELKEKDKVAQAQDHARRRRREETEQEERLHFLKADTPVESHRPRHGSDDEAKRRIVAKGFLVDAPAAVPYTQPNSEFLYGTFAVLAALRSRRRKIHKLYLWCGEDGNLLDSDEHTTEIVRLAKVGKVPLLRVAGSWEKMLDRMSERRPHNGLILEATPLPRLPANALQAMTSPDDALTVDLIEHMDKDEKEELGIASTAKSHSLPRPANSQRYPFLLWLDRVTDTGNMGAIFRTAYFFGVDAIVVPQHGTAPLNAVVIKTSAGAAEHMPVIKIGNEREFMKRSKENGWKFFAAAAQASESTMKRGKSGQLSKGDGVFAPLKSSPCVLMLGNEGTGLRRFLQQDADESIAIESPLNAGNRVDSLNVSVAAALLTQRFVAP